MAICRGAPVFFLALLCLCSAQSHASTGSARDTYKTVIPLAVVPYPCVSVKAQGARILLSRDELVSMRAKARPGIHTEDERQSFIDGMRAKNLLNSVSPTLVDNTGCLVVTLSKDPRHLDTLYVVSRLLEEGKAAVIRDGNLSPERKIIVNDHNDLLMGLRNFLFTDGKEFFSVTTWVTMVSHPFETRTIV